MLANRFMLLLLATVALGLIQISHAEIMADDLGPITDVLVDGDKIYFFEIDPDSDSATWIHDTTLSYLDDGYVRILSNVEFIYPTEITDMHDDVMFATLSESCLGKITCDYQDIVRMSKTDGSFKVIDSGLKSAVRLSADGNNLYVSESNGMIWRFDFDNAIKELVYDGENIIMDIAADDGNVYIIEEIVDQKNRVIVIDPSGQIATIRNDLHIPYDLKAEFGHVSWGNIEVKPSHESINDFTSFEMYEDGSIKKIAEFKNTSPVAMAQDEPHYKTYFVYGDYIIMANNTAHPPVIQLLNHKTDGVLDLTSIEDYEIKYFRSDHENLYVIGSDEDGFLIDRIQYPVPIPEFGPVAIMVLSAVLAAVTVFLRRDITAVP